MKDLTRRAAVGTLWSVTGHFATAALSILGTLVLIRALSPAQFGDYALAGAMVIVFSVVAGFGLDSIVIREITRAPERTSEFVSTAMLLRLLLAVPAVLAAVTMSYVLGYSPEVRLLTLVGCVMYVGGSITMLQTVLAVRLRFENVFLVNVLPQALVTGALVGLVAIGAPLVAIVASEAAIRLTGLLLLVPLSRSVMRIRFAWSATLARKMMRDGAVLFFVALSGVALTKLHLFILARYADPVDTGYFAAAARIVDVMSAAGAAFFVSALPLVAHYAMGDRATFERVTARAFRYLYVGAIPALALVTALAPWVTPLALGADMAPAAPILQALVWVQVFWFTSTLVGSILLVEHKPWHILALNVASGGLNILLAMALIPALGGIGAALASVVSAGLALSLLAIPSDTRPLFKAVMLAFGRTALAVVPGAIVFGLVLVSSGSGIWAFAAGFTVFAAASVMFRVVTLDDVALLRETLRIHRRAAPSDGTMEGDA